MTVPRLGPATALPPGVERPGYDRGSLAVGSAHLGVGAFHRCHQAEFTDDMLARRFGRWGIVGVNIREPHLQPALGEQDGLYTRVLRRDDHAEARVIGCLRRVVDAQSDPDAALAVLAAPEIEVVTLTVTEKGYCHRPATGTLDPDRPDIAHDRAHPDRPKSAPGLLALALDRRRRTHGRPITLVSCDNVAANGSILRSVVAAMAAARDPRLPDWIEANAAFPSTMVDRIVPATTPADRAAVTAAHGYEDQAVVVGEPFRQWVIEERFAGRRPGWDLAGATFVADVTPHEQLKMRVLNAAQSTLAYLGLLAGHACTSDAVANPRIADFTRAMLIEETLPTLRAVTGTEPLAYVDRSLARIRNRAIRHTCGQIATDGSQKIVQRLVSPAAERLRAGAPFPHLATAIAAWMTWLVRAAPRFGAAWPADDPEAARVAAMAEKIGRDPPALAAAILALDTVFDPSLADSDRFRAAVTRALDRLLSADPLAALNPAKLEVP